MKKILIFLVLILIASGYYAQDTGANSNQRSDFDYLTQSVLWYQKSAEMRALYYQAFNMAKMVLDDKLMKVRLSNPAALVVDIDETMLDNSAFETHVIKTNQPYSKERWLEWTAMEKAEPLPGAVEFMQHATEKGVEVFYISNRYHEEMAQTIKILKKYDFPNADSAHVLLKTTTSDKTPRRDAVRENHVILMFLGDNLADFSEDFNNRKENYGFDAVDAHKDDFGSVFFMLPNPMYGDWDKPIYDYRRDLSEPEKAKKRYENLRGYE